MASNSVDNAVFTTDVEKDLYIFFGNMYSEIKVAGPNVVGITNVKGNFKNVEINDDGTATVTLPELSTETTTNTVVTIKLKDGTTITRTFNIVRTAIILNHSEGNSDNSLFAGYVFNKEYLYNNLNHNDNIFDAYLQVILYKDDTVVGFKQVKINDEAAINNLNDNDSGALEILSENQIPLYGKVTGDLIDGVNRASVFLTNGKIDGNSNKLPSIEFGIGAGVQISWGVK